MKPVFGKFLDLNLIIIKFFNRNKMKFSPKSGRQKSAVSTEVSARRVVAQKGGREEWGQQELQGILLTAGGKLG